MARKKLDLTYIINDSKRKTTLKKRKHGLIKKMNEITTLCGIEACAIIYSPNDPQPEVWPSEPEVQRKITMIQIQEGAPVTENGEEHGYMHHVQGLENNIDTIQNQH
ncbi:Transcription factor [Vigna unguiculata]|uniref:Transcription factor n=1 Tax=Vigna unguiculata TaxID=3917 RepID=A0A4D6LS87_VIGUN|nr:Transcription factor [Vigna unguiculata]